MNLNCNINSKFYSKVQLGFISTSIFSSFLVLFWRIGPYIFQYNDKYKPFCQIVETSNPNCRCDNMNRDQNVPIVSVQHFHSLEERYFLLCSLWFRRWAFRRTPFTWGVILFTRTASDDLTPCLNETVVCIVLERRWHYFTSVLSGCKKSQYWR